MPERAFLTETWDDDWFHGLLRDQRYLFIYLWTNSRCTQAGVYHINLATMAFETKFTAEELPELLKSLSPKVEWYQEQNYVWVRNFIKWQAKSPKFLVAAAKCLKNIKNNGLVKEVINYNLKEHSVSIPYEEAIDRVSIGYQYPIDTSLTPNPSNTGPDTKPGLGGKKGVVKGGKVGLAATTATETATESQLLEFLETLEGWRFGRADDLAWLREFRQDWPDFDLLLAKACRDYHSGRMPPKHKGVWKNRFREWMRHERKYEEERHGRTGEHRQDTQRDTKPHEWEEAPDEPDDTS